MDKKGNQKTNGGTANQESNNYWKIFISFITRFVSWITEHDRFTIAFSTICIASFTLFLFISTILQWSIMRRSLQLDQRAWMGITQITAQFEIGKPIIATIGFKNTGKTPAKNVTISGIG